MRIWGTWDGQGYAGDLRFPELAPQIIHLSQREGRQARIEFGRLRALRRCWRLLFVANAILWLESLFQVFHSWDTSSSPSI